jgi:uncharacterized membrane protein
MSDQIPPQQPPFTNVPFSDVPNAGPAVPPQQPGYPPQQPGYPPPQQGYAPPQAGYPPQQAQYPQAPASAGLSTNSAAALAYVTIIPAIVFLVLEPYNKTPLVRFHSIQCLLLAGVSFVLSVGLTIMSLVLHAIPLIGILFAFLHLALFLIIAVAWLMAIIKASKGEWFKLPVIGDQALKMAQGG